MPAAGIGRRPTRPLPSLKSFELGSLVQGHHKVEFAIGMAVILSAQHIVVFIVLETHGSLAVHVDGRNAELEGLRRRLKNAAAPIIRTVDFLVGSPSLLYPDLYETREVLVQIAPLAVFLVEPPFHLGARRHVLDLLKERNASLNEFFSTSHYRFLSAIR